ncbi:MAG TPA: hypothetical protein VFJ82_09710 [Longimicrobium sp.]|nr:hypothetical protein [Longimicrobium sp.]
MRRPVAATAAALLTTLVLAGPAAAQDMRGTWFARESHDTQSAPRIHLELRNHGNNWGLDVPVSELEGLDAGNAAGGAARFRLRREAGTFAFNGTFSDGEGVGSYTFTPDAGFAAALARRGLARPTPQQQWSMALGDVGVGYVDELARQGYARTVTTAGLVRAAEHGAGLRYLREMGALGYRVGTLDALITLRDHGVTASWVREMAELGYRGIAAPQATRLVDHGVRPSLVRELAGRGYRNLSLDELSGLVDHGVSASFIQEIGALGYRNVPLGQLVRLRDHGVSAGFIRELNGLGYRGLSLEELVRMRDHGVSTGFVEQTNARAGRRLSVPELVSLRDRGAR